MDVGAVTEVADGVWAIAGTGTTAYVVRDGDAVTVVDAGYPGDRELLLAGLRRVGAPLREVEAVLLTHGHVDHIGSAELLRSRHDAEVVCHELEAPNVRGERQQRISDRDMVVRLWSPSMMRFVFNVMRARALSVEHVGEVRTFDAETPLDLPGRPVPVFTPGHTSGHCAYHLPARGVLITGDALVTEDPISRQTGPRLINRLFNHDHERARDSLQRLSSLLADVILPGHGAPWRGSPADAVELALQTERGR